jgi:hypothetical protein
LDNAISPATAYFCFNRAVVNGWDELVNNWRTISEVEVEFDVNDKGNKKVTGLYFPSKI